MSLYIKKRLDITRVLIPSAVVLLTQSMSAAYAQEKVEFFDDFSSNSYGYQVDNNPDDNSERSFVVTPGGIEMRVSATGDEQGQAKIRIADRTDTVRARFSISSETVIPADDDGQVRLRIEGPWYNDIQDGGLGGDDRTGDVFIQAGLRLRGAERRDFEICLDREQSDGSNQGVPIFEGDNCIDMPDFELELNTVYEAHISLDRALGIIRFGIDGQEIERSIGQPIYLPSNYDKRIQLVHEGASGQAVGMVSAIGTDGNLQDFKETPLVMGPYRPVYDLQDGVVDLNLSEGRLRFDATAPVDNRQNLSLTLNGPSDRIEGVIELSSESNVLDADDSFAQMRLSGTFYNDQGEGGINGDEGNVFSAITLRATPGDVRTLEYCLFRSDATDFSSATELECGDFGIVAEYDTSYKASINFDRDAGTVTFTVDGEERVYTSLTQVFAPDPERQFVRAQARANAGSTVVGYLDDFGTSSDAPPVGSNQSGGGSAGSTSSSSGGSSGCSIAGGRGVTDWTFLIMALVAMFACTRRRMINK